MTENKEKTEAIDLETAEFNETPDTVLETPKKEEPKAGKRLSSNTMFVAGAGVVSAAAVGGTAAYAMSDSDVPVEEQVEEDGSSTELDGVIRDMTVEPAPAATPKAAPAQAAAAEPEPEEGAVTEVVIVDDVEVEDVEPVVEEVSTDDVVVVEEIEEPYAPEGPGSVDVDDIAEDISSDYADDITVEPMDVFE